MSDCIEWTGTITSDGRGVLTVGSSTDGTRRRLYAHRKALADHLGVEYDDLGMACHHCDNPACVNPEHLYDGDARSNAGDMVRRKRHWNNRKTSCKNGHEFDESNTYFYKGQRQCRACRAAYQRQRRRKME